MLVHITERENLESILENGFHSNYRKEGTLDIDTMLWESIESLEDEIGDNKYTRAMNIRESALYFFEEDEDYQVTSYSSNEIKIAVDIDKLDLSKLYVADMAIVDDIAKYSAIDNDYENSEEICNIMKSYLGSMVLYTEYDPSEFEIAEFLYTGTISPDMIRIIE